MISKYFIRSIAVCFIISAIFYVGCKQASLAIEVSSITIKASDQTIAVGTSQKLSVSIYPIDASNQRIEWSSNNPSVLAVDDSGVITAKSVGIAVISAKAGRKTSSIPFTINAQNSISPSSNPSSPSNEKYVPVESIKIDEERTEFFIRDQVMLAATLFPQDASNRNYTWTTEDSDKIKLLEYGFFEPIKEGSATIKVTTQDGEKTDSITINIKSVPVQKIELNMNQVSLDEEDLFSGLTATIYPANASNTRVKWESSNTDVASVEFGTVKANKAGNTTITVTTLDGNFTASCEILVKALFDRGTINVVSDSSESIENLLINEDEEKSFLVSLQNAPTNSEDIKIVSSNKNCVITPDTLSFSSENYNVQQRVTIKANHVKDDFDDKIDVITFKNNKFHEKKINIDVKNTDIPDFSISVFDPTDIEYVKIKKYLILFYDVDFIIDRLFIDIMNDGNWVDISSIDYSSWTSNSCSIDLRKFSGYTGGPVKLKAHWKVKPEKIIGEPQFTLEGFKVKATIGDYSEYFYLSSSPTTTTISGSVQNKYKVFYKDGAPLYLTLREKSSSRFTVDGLSPTSFVRIHEATQDLRRVRYTSLSSPYIPEYNPNDPNKMRVIKFLSVSEPDQIWDEQLAKAVQYFNECMAEMNIRIEMTTDEKETQHRIIHAPPPTGDAGVCMRYIPNFSIYITPDRQWVGAKELLHVIIHEMGHLIGFNDSAYARIDSLFCYSGDKRTVTFFQPSDLVTFKYWEGIPFEADGIRRP